MWIADKDTSGPMVAGQELDPELSEQQWLFRQGDLVLGPISGQQLVEKLFTGEMNGDTLIAPPGERDFVRMADAEAFKIHVARAVAKARVDADVRTQRQRALRKRMIFGGIAAAVTVVLAIGAWQVARWAAVHGPGGDEDEYAGITVDLPTIAVAQARKDDQELIAYPSSSPTPRPPPDKVASAEPPKETKPKPSPGTSSTTPSLPASAVAAKTEKKPTGNVTTDPDGLQMTTEFDQESINKVVKNNQKTLFRCLKEEAERRPGFAAKVPIEFVIGNDGRVSKLWVDHPQLKQGPLYECFLTELKKWPFKPYKGELASVNLAFKVG
jgi:hypothetical protein